MISILLLKHSHFILEIMRFSNEAVGEKNDFTTVAIPPK